MSLSKKRYFYVVSCIIMLLLLGIAYAWSVFVKPLEDTYGYTRTQTSMAYTILMISYAFGSLLAGFFINRLGVRKMSIFGALSIGCGFLVTSFVDSIYVLYITYSIFCGVGIGLIYNVVVSVLPRWFPDMRGTITGVLLMGYAMSAMILSPVCQKLLEFKGVPFTFRLLGMMNLIVLLGGGLLLHTPKEEDLAQLPKAPVPANAEQTKKSAGAEMNTVQMVKNRNFWLYFISLQVWCFVALSVLNHMALALQNELAVSAASAALAVSTLSLCNGLSRPVIGRIFDRTNVKTVALLIAAFTFVGAVIAWFGLSRGSVAVLIFGECVLLVGYGFQGGATPTVTRVLFGEEHFSMNYSVVSCAVLTASFGPSIVGAIQSQTGTYSSSFLMLAIISLIALLCTVGLKTE